MSITILTYRYVIILPLHQIDHRDGMNKKERADKEFLERLEQVQLAEDLAAQRDQYLRERHGEKEKYKEALATQVRGERATPNASSIH